MRRSGHRRKRRVNVPAERVLFEHRGVFYGECLAIAKPLLRPVFPFDGGAVFPVQLAMPPPFLRAVGVFDGGTIIAMQFAVAPPLAPTVGPDNGRSAVPMPAAFAPPLFGAGREFDRGTPVAMQT